MIGKIRVVDVPNEVVQLIDVNNLSFRNYFAIKHGHEFPVIYGMLRSIKQFKERLGCDDFVFCFDSQRSLRAEKYPRYKRREETQDRSIVREELKVLHNILKELGYATLQVDGAEADDLIAYLCQVYEKKECVIYSSDSDLNQLLEQKVWIWNPFNKSSFTVKDLWEKHELFAEEWALYRAIVGNDKIEGVKGVGDKLAKSWIRERLPENHHAVVKITEEIYTVNENKKLLTLPFEELKFPKKKLKLRSPDPDTWNCVMKKYGMDLLVGRCP